MSFNRSKMFGALILGRDHQLCNAPNVIRQTGFHRGRYAKAGMYAAEVVVGEVVEFSTNAHFQTLPNIVPRCRCSSQIDIMGAVMTTIHPASNDLVDICDRVKHLGYAVSGKVRLYGEEFEVVSDPFPAADGIAVHVKSKKNPTVRVLQLPTTVLQGVRPRRPAKKVA